MSQTQIQKSPLRTVKNQRGQGLVEYLIIVALVAVATLSVMRVVGQSVQVKFAQVAKALGATVTDDIGEATVIKTNWKKKDMNDFMTGAQ
ncbi:MAG: Flp family type IVb pilin [Bdellovibrionaceae bacterium]|nr:Flp family type IVb pilin [Pseudobdellovibrionaceae bacterium]